jgi:hypothetical protein
MGISIDASACCRQGDEDVMRCPLRFLAVAHFFWGGLLLLAAAALWSLQFQFMATMPPHLLHLNLSRCLLWNAINVASWGLPVFWTIKLGRWDWTLKSRLRYVLLVVHAVVVLCCILAAVPSIQHHTTSPWSFLFLIFFYYAPSVVMLSFWTIVLVCWNWTRYSLVRLAVLVVHIGLAYRCAVGMDLAYMAFASVFWPMVLGLWMPAFLGIWMIVLGRWAWNMRPQIILVLLISHCVLLLLGMSGISLGIQTAEAAERSAAHGGGLLGVLGWSPLWFSIPIVNLASISLVLVLLMHLCEEFPDLGDFVSDNNAWLLPAILIVLLAAINGYIWSILPAAVQKTQFKGMALTGTALPGPSPKETNDAEAARLRAQSQLKSDVAKLHEFSQQPSKDPIPFLHRMITDERLRELQNADERATLALVSSNIPFAFECLDALDAERTRVSEQLDALSSDRSGPNGCLEDRRRAISRKLQDLVSVLRDIRRVPAEYESFLVQRADRGGEGKTVAIHMIGNLDIPPIERGRLMLAYTACGANGAARATPRTSATVGVQSRSGASESKRTGHPSQSGRRPNQPQRAGYTPLALSIESDRQVYEEGEPICFTVTITNTSSRKLSVCARYLRLPNCRLQEGICDIHNSRHERIPVGLRLEPAEMRKNDFETLMPRCGRSYHFDLYEVLKTGLKPDTYTITYYYYGEQEYEEDSVLKKTDYPWSGVVVSEPITIRVLPASDDIRVLEDTDPDYEPPPDVWHRCDDPTLLYCAKALAGPSLEMGPAWNAANEFVYRTALKHKCALPGASVLWQKGPDTNQRHFYVVTYRRHDSNDTLRVLVAVDKGAITKLKVVP